MHWRIIIVLILLSYQLGATGSYPADVNWQHIQPKHSKVIYPKGLDQQAKRIGNTIDYMASAQPNPIGSRVKPVSIILQSDQVISNGYVGLFPFHSSFYATGLQSNHRIGSTDWLDGLSTHEYRHVLQFFNALQGITKWAYLLSGEIGAAAFAGLSVPNWFWEGDAVLTETLLSSSGRGRLPHFSKEQRALLLGNKPIYGYQKARNGSFKDLVPSHYPLGYLMVNYVRNHFAPDTWRKVFADAVRYKHVFYPFSRALKRHTGYTTDKLYKAAYQELGARYQKHLDTTELTPTQPITQKPDIVTHYMFPHYLGTDSLLVLKESYAETEKLVLITSDKEIPLTTIGLQSSPYLSVTGGKAIWTELRKNPRRANENYHAIVTYDVHTNTKKVLLKKTKYFSPEYHPKGDKIIAVEINPLMQRSLVILNAKTGDMMERLPNINNDFLSYPKWTQDADHIVYVGKRMNQIALFKQEITTGTTTQLMPWTTHSIGQFVVDHTRIYFSASFSGIDNIYAVDLDGGPIYQVTSVPVGAYMPNRSKANNELFFSEFTDRGYQLAQMTVPQKLPKISLQTPQEMSLFQVKTDTIAHDILGKIPEHEHTEKPYHSSLTKLRPYNWGVGFGTGSSDYFLVRLGLADIFNNWLVNLAYINHGTDGYKRYHTSVSYAKWLPILSTHIDYIDRDQDNLGTVPLSNNASNTIVLSGASEYIMGTGASIPLVDYNGNAVRSLTVATNVQYRSIRSQNLDLYNWHQNLSFNINKRKAIQHIFPKLGFGLKMDYFRSLSTDVKAEKLDVLANGFASPNLIANDGFKLTGRYVNTLQQSSGYVFPYNYGVVRSLVGTATSTNLADLKKWSADYVMPLAYPHIGGAGIFYVSRLRWTTFYDVAQLKYVGSNSRTYQSVGGILTADGTVLNSLPISFTLTGSYLIDKPDFENEGFSVWVGFILGV